MFPAPVYRPTQSIPSSPFSQYLSGFCQLPCGVNITSTQLSKISTCFLLPFTILQYQYHRQSQLCQKDTQDPFKTPSSTWTQMNWCHTIPCRPPIWVPLVQVNRLGHIIQHCTTIELQNKGAIHTGALHFIESQNKRAIHTGALHHRNHGLGRSLLIKQNPGGSCWWLPPKQADSVTLSAAAAASGKGNE